MKSKKIFCIGFNKTGTSSLSAIAKSCRIKSLHNPEWAEQSRLRQPQFFEKFNFYCDGGLANFEWLDQQFNAFFILNTRPLTSWLVSRYNHVERNKRLKKSGIKKSWTDNTESAIENWIKMRIWYHKKSYSYFQKKTNFLTIDFWRMSSRQITKRLESIFEHKIEKIPRKNVAYKLESYQTLPGNVYSALKNLNMNLN